MRQKFSRLRRIGSLAIIALLFLSSCGQAANDNNTAGTPEASGASDGTLRIAMYSDIVSMDVHKTSNDYMVPMNVFDTLFKVVKNSDGSTSIEKSLVEDYSVSDDGLTYSFTLKNGVVFSDGTPLTAEDVKFTFERMLTLPDSQQTDFAISIKGAQELLDGNAQELSGISIQDDTHFTITLAEPFSVFLAQLATPSVSIMSKSIVTEAGDDFGIVPEKTLGTGPYVVDSWDRGQGIELSYNPKYWGPEPSVKHVSARIMDASSMDMAFQKGDLDIVDCLMIDSAIVDATYKTKYKDNIVSVDRLGINYLMFNEKSGPLSDVKVRKAIQMAIDRQSILDSIYAGDGKLEDGVYPSGCLGYSRSNQGWLKYDPSAAKKLLKEAGYPDGFEMELAQDSEAAEANKNMIQIIAQNLGDVGITANIKNYDHASWLDLRNSGDMESFLAMWILDFNDPDNVIYTFFGNKGNTVLRSNNYADEDTIARIAAARGIVDQKDRMAEYAALEKKLVQEDAVWAPMFSLKHLFVKSDRVAEFIPHWAGWSDIYFTGVTLK